MAQSHHAHPPRTAVQRRGNTSAGSLICSSGGFRARRQSGLLPLPDARHGTVASISATILGPGTSRRTTTPAPLRRRGSRSDNALVRRPHHRPPERFRCSFSSLFCLYSLWLSPGVTTIPGPATDRALMARTSRSTPCPAHPRSSHPGVGPRAGKYGEFWAACRTTASAAGCGPVSSPRVTSRGGLRSMTTNSPGCSPSPRRRGPSTPSADPAAQRPFDRHHPSDGHRVTAAPSSLIVSLPYRRPR
jgi:hypothetical protein